MIGYLKGLGCFYLSILMFAALRWVSFGSGWGMKWFLTPLAVSAITWTLVFIAHYLIGELLDFLDNLFVSISLIGLGIVGYVSFLLAGSILPPDLFAITSVKDPVIMGLVCVLISLAVHPSKIIRKVAKKE